MTAVSAKRKGLALAAIATLGLATFATATLSAPEAEAISDSDLIVGTVGEFSNPLRPNGVDLPDCIQYGTGDPATYDPSSTNQSSTIGDHNELRTGQNWITGICPTDPADSSGLGFTGLSGTETVGSYGALGRFNHYNETVQQSMHWADLAVTMQLRNPIDNTVSSVTVDYTIEVQESPEKSPLRGETVADCQYQPGETNGLAGSTVPDDVNNYQDGLFIYCADAVAISPASETQTVTWGETSVQVEVGGWAYVDPATGECDASNVVDGPVIYTAEQSSNELCVLGRIAPAESISVTKTVVGEDGTVTVVDGDFQITATELDQQSGTLVSTTAIDETVEAGTSAGTFTANDVAPGLYSLSEASAATNTERYENGAFECEKADGSDAIIVVDGESYLDVDSNDAISCTLENEQLRPLAIYTLGNPTCGADGNPVVPADDANATYVWDAANDQLVATPGTDVEFDVTGSDWELQTDGTAIYQGSQCAPTITTVALANPTCGSDGDPELPADDANVTYVWDDANDQLAATPAANTELDVTGTAWELQADGTAIYSGAQCVDPTTEPTTDPTTEPTTDPTEEPTSEPTDSATTTPTTTAPSATATSGDSMPDTGAETMPALFIAFGLLAVGGAVMALRRRAQQSH